MKMKNRFGLGLLIVLLSANTAIAKTQSSTTNLVISTQQQKQEIRNLVQTEVNQILDENKTKLNVVLVLLIAFPVITGILVLLLYRRIIQQVVADTQAQLTAELNQQTITFQQDIERLKSEWASQLATIHQKQIVEDEPKKPVFVTSENLNSHNSQVQIKLTSENDDYFTQGNTSFSAGDYESAIAAYDKVLEIKPDDHEAWFKRGVALGHLSRNEEAITAFDEVLKLKPENYEAWYNRGLALESIGKYQEAIASYEEVLKLKPDDIEAWYNRGLALGNIGRYVEEIASYQQVFKFNPEDYEAWYSCGVALVNLGKNQEAILCFNKVLKNNAADHEAWYNRGQALKNLGQYPEAIQCFDQAVIIKPDLQQAWYNKACYCALVKNVDLAIENLQQAIKLNSEYKKFARTDSDFDAIREDERFQRLIAN
jgi:tetratricopeptide (TPR) repeat protein